MCASGRRAFVARTAWCTFFALTALMDIFSRVFNPKFFFLWHWMCVSSPFSSSTSRFLLLVARLHGKTPNMSPPAPLMRSLALEYFLGHQEHTHSVGCALFGLCVCIEHWVKLQHAQHGAQTWWMCSTHFTPCFRPPGMCVWSVLPGFDVISWNLHPACTLGDQVTTAWISTTSGTTVCSVFVL